MSIKISLNHQISYTYDRPIILGPHTLKLRPSPHCRTPIQSYTLSIDPQDSRMTWQQDPYGNYLARLNFPNRTDHLKIEVDLIAELQPINPFNFLVESYAESYPFTYQFPLSQELIPFLEVTESGDRLKNWIESHRQSNLYITNFLTTINQQLAQEIQYKTRLEPGIQSCEETLEKEIGSCRDTAWLLVQILRHYGLASRFVSGYLIQLQEDSLPLESSPHITHDQADLHAWAEVYLPGAGWIGLDPTSGFLTAEGHIPLVGTAEAQAASPVFGSSEPCESQLTFSITVSRHQETARRTKPYREEQWQKIQNLGQSIETRLQQFEIGLTMGSELTFVCIDDFESSQGQVAEFGEEKRQIAEQLQHRLATKFANPRGTIGFQIIPDVSVIKININPVSNWNEVVRIIQILYEEAQLCRLRTEKYLLDGRQVSAGGGNPITIGGKTVEDSPLLRRPDLLRSLISYWINHPSLSYFFSGLFVNPTRQSPQVDEIKFESLYELEIAFQYLQPDQPIPPELVDQLLRNLFVDIPGNPHCSDFCIDKLYPVEKPSHRLGLLEFRGFALPPHPQMALLQMLLIRAFVAWFWQKPYNKPLMRWGTTLRDRFMLPYYLKEDLKAVITDLQSEGFAFELEWFDPFFEFRFPRYGEIVKEGIELELRQGIEPWHVLGEEIVRNETAQYINSSMERIQVMLRGAMGNSPNLDSFSSRYIVTCNGYPIPLKSTGITGEYVGAVRFRARRYTSILHPAINPHESLIFDIVDTWTERSIGGCTYYVNAPNGTLYQTFPINHREAQSRMTERFIPLGHTPGKINLKPIKMSPEYPLTLDLRRLV